MSPFWSIPVLKLIFLPDEMIPTLFLGKTNKMLDSQARGVFLRSGAFVEQGVFDILFNMEVNKSTFFSGYGDLQRTGELIYQPQLSEQELAIREKWGELALRRKIEGALPETADASSDLPPAEPSLEPISLEVFKLTLSDQNKKPLAMRTEGIARAYMGRHINRLRTVQNIDRERLKFCDVIPNEEVIVLFEQRSQIPHARRHSTNPIFMHIKRLADPMRLDAPREIGIHPDKVALILRVDSPDAQPLPEWLPRVLPKAAIVNLGYMAVQKPGS